MRALKIILAVWLSIVVPSIVGCGFVLLGTKIDKQGKEITQTKDTQNAITQSDQEIRSMIHLNEMKEAALAIAHDGLVQTVGDIRTDLKQASADLRSASSISSVAASGVAEMLKRMKTPPQVFTVDGQNYVIGIIRQPQDIAAKPTVGMKVIVNGQCAGNEHVEFGGHYYTLDKSKTDPDQTPSAPCN